MIAEPDIFQIKTFHWCWSLLSQNLPCFRTHQRQHRLHCTKTFDDKYEKQGDQFHRLCTGAMSETNRWGITLQILVRGKKQEWCFVICQCDENRAKQLPINMWYHHHHHHYHHHHHHHQYLGRWWLQDRTLHLGASPAKCSSQVNSNYNQAYDDLHFKQKRWRKTTIIFFTSRLIPWMRRISVCGGGQTSGLASERHLKLFNWSKTRWRQTLATCF